MQFWGQIYGTTLAQLGEGLKTDGNEDIAAVDINEKMQEFVKTASAYACLATEELERKIREVTAQSKLATAAGPDPSAGGPLGMRGIN